MATIRKKRDKWAVSIRRSFHKPLFKSFVSKQDAQFVRIRIFEHCKKINLNIFSQVLGWKKAINLQKLPTTYKEGSIFFQK